MAKNKESVLKEIKATKKEIYKLSVRLYMAEQEIKTSENIDNVVEYNRFVYNLLNDICKDTFKNVVDFFKSKGLTV